MLSNAYFLAKFRFDTAENEPAKNLQKFAKKIANFANSARGAAVRVVRIDAPAASSSAAPPAEIAARDIPALPAGVRGAGAPGE